MQHIWFLPFFFLLLFHFSPSASAFGVGIWIGGGINNQSPPPISTSKLYTAFTALQAWKSAITDDPKGVLSSWVGKDVCSYKGIYCTRPLDMSSDLVVAGIDLNHASLQGTLVKELSLLSDLSIIHLNSNRFTGTVPESFSELVSLTELDLSNNYFSGPFPSVTLLIPNLVYLDLRYNHFSGPLPEELFNMGLDAIFLNNNLFDGQIPESLGNSPASVITFANNRFSGSIPTSFGFMGSGLREILFHNNQLTGCIPEGVGLLSEVEVLDLSNNAFSGHLPDTISCLSEIEVLNLAHNQLSGVLSEVVCNLRSLANLTVSFNFFSGLAQDCTRLFRNVGFDFSGNCIPGKNMQRPPPECSDIPGGLNCLRIPSLAGVGICTSLDQRLAVSNPSPSTP